MKNKIVKRKRNSAILIRMLPISKIKIKQDATQSGLTLEAYIRTKLGVEEKEKQILKAKTS